MISIKTIKIENFILLIYILLLTSEWVGGYVWQPVGIRHVYLLLIPFYIFITSKDNKLIFSRKPLIYLSCAISFLFLSSIFTSRFNLSVFLGWFFTYFFFINYFLIILLNPFVINIYKLLKNIVYINFLFSLFPFLDFIINSVSLRESTGVFRDSSAFASIMLISVFICYFFLQTYKSTKWKILLYYFSFLILLITMKKSIIILIIFLFLKYLPKLNFFSKIIAIFFFILMLFLTSTNLINNISDVLYYESNVDISDHVRWGMYFGAFVLQSNFFPFGSGFSTYGSLFSIYDINTGTYIMNKTYYDLGLNNLADNEARLDNARTTFLDTYYPHIIGEGGFIQLFLIFLIIRFFLSTLKIISKYNFNTDLYSLFVWITLMIFIDGITIISPEMPLFIFFFSTLVAVINRTNYTFIQK